MAPPAQGKKICTLLFSANLTVLILSFIAFLIGLALVIRWFSAGALWILIASVLAFASGLYGVLSHPDKEPRCVPICHVVLAVANLVDIVVLGIALLVSLGISLFVILLVAIFGFQLWVVVLETCCHVKGSGGGSGAVPVGGGSIPMANPTAKSMPTYNPQHQDDSMAYSEGVFNEHGRSQY
jgi:hypothetical protein